MPEGITGAVWAFGWGLAAASGVLGGANSAAPAPHHCRHHVIRSGCAAFSRLY